MNPSPKLSRRYFLRGSGLAVALPALSSLAHTSLVAEETVASASAVTPTGAPLRMAFMSIPNGVQQDHWFPQDGLQLSETMKPLEKLRDQFQVISGLDHINATPGPDGAGDHARANATFLTGARARKTAGSDIRCGISVDQVAAQRIERATRLPSLELTSDVIRNSGSCDSGYACAYQYNLAWSSATTPVTPEANPRLVFERLFGAGSRSERKRNFAARRETQKSVLDFVLEDSRDVRRQLAKEDRRKFDEYHSVVRDMEQRFEHAERFDDLPEADRDAPAGIPHDFGEYMTLMYDMLLLAFQTDSTRVATLLLAYDGSNRTFPHLGIPEGHHWLTHSQREEGVAQKVARIDQYYVERFAQFLQKMADTVDVDGNSLLHNSMLVYGGAIADGNRHTHENLPVILAGQAGGRIRTGRFYQAQKQPMSNLFVSMLNLMGHPVTEFGDSTGKLDLA